METQKVDPKQYGQVLNTQVPSVTQYAVDFGGPSKEFILKVRDGNAPDDRSHLEHVHEILAKFHVPYSTLYGYYPDGVGVKIQRSPENLCDPPSLEELKQAFAECYMHFQPMTFDKLKAKGNMQFYFMAVRIRRVDHASRNDFNMSKDLVIGVNFENQLILATFVVHRTAGVFPVQENNRFYSANAAANANQGYNALQNASEAL